MTVNKILTINGTPETFDSELPRGVHGSLELLDAMVDVVAVLYVEVDNEGSYEGNIDGEWTVKFVNGDEIRFDGYYGDRGLLCYDRLSIQEKYKALKCFHEHLSLTVEDINS